MKTSTASFRSRGRGVLPSSAAGTRPLPGRRPVVFLALYLLFAATGWASAYDSSTRTLRCGWYPWDPYQFLDPEAELPLLTGLDVKLVRAVFRDAGYTVDFGEEVSWARHQADIRDGARDIAAGTFMTPERAAYAWFSKPYRTETDVLYVRPGEAGRLPAATTGELLRRMSARRFRIGIVDGYNYGPEVMAWIADPANRGLVFPTGNDYDNLVRLLDNRIDGFLADRLAGATLAWRKDLQSRLEEHPVPVFHGELRVMFSKRTMSVRDVEAFNRSLDRLRDSGAYHQIVREYLFPVLLAMTVHRPWFFVLDILGTLAFAVSGVLLARRERYDIFGAFVLAALPAVGGGVLRDLLTDRNPLGVMRDPVYLLAILGVVVTGALCYRLWDRAQARKPDQAAPLAAGTKRRHRSPRFARNLFLVCDALGLAAFTVVGVVVAVETRCHPLWLWGPILATLTGAGGGIIRDVVRADSNNPSLKGSIYPEISVAWGLAFSLFLIWETSRLKLPEVLAGVIVTLSGVLLTRWLVVRWGVRSLFMYDRRRYAPSVALDRVAALQSAWLASLPALLEGSRETRPAGGFDLEAVFNSCLAWEDDARSQLTDLAAEQLPEDNLKTKILLEKRQWRLSALQADLREFTACTAFPRGEGPAAAFFVNLAEALDAICRVAADALGKPGGEDAAILRQVTDEPAGTLAKLRREYLASMTGTDPETLRAVLHGIGLFERCVGHLQALGRTLGE
ncbi:MAG: TRIC cation channel family protein [Acidobacteria bacterium]|nr:TRIC cation channel family protein [Acidobacteriota bacterium]